MEEVVPQALHRWKLEKVEVWEPVAANLEHNFVEDMELALHLVEDFAESH